MTMADVIDEARRVRLNARAPYSGFKVGAALETREGEVFTGCNVENSTYGLTVCAERVALWKAISEGESEFRRIAVVADTEVLIPPCGACRQLLWEFCGDVEVILANLRGDQTRHQLKTLFPFPFDQDFLPKE
jgi:cytidine deaminase